MAGIDFLDDVTEEEAEQYTRDLVLLLEDLDVDEVRPVEGESVAGTRSADPATVAGAVLVTGVLLKPVLAHAVTLIGAWIEQSGQRSVTVEVEGARVTVQGTVAPGDVETYVRALRPDAGRSVTGGPEESDT
ncbi:hypothetical protein [Nocardiopsis sp. LOL_012]|uniref:hypothetical protein n=1 Tax=Nocardiopsis sp. LOL_012 TaxID=3345409 RepID=UPI003A8C2FA7